MWRNGQILLMDMEIGTAFREKSMEVSQKIKIELPYDLAVSFWVYI